MSADHPFGAAPRPGAIFDLDGTLVAGTSAERLFVPWLRRRGVLGPRQWIPFASVALLAPFVGPGLAFRRNKRYVRGLDVERVRQLAREFVGEELAPRFRARLVARLGELRERGPVCLLTGSPDILAAAVADRFALDEGLGTALGVAHGRCTGRLAGTHWYGERKVQGLAELARRHALDLTRSWGFADTEHDIPFLEAFGNPVAVDPDPGLRAHALRAGWEIVDGDDPVAGGHARDERLPDGPSGDGRRGDPGADRPADARA